MSVKIANVSPYTIEALENLYPESFEHTKTTVKFWGHKDHVLQQLELTKEKAAEVAGNRLQAPYAWMHAVVRKVRKAQEAR